ncbi:hypothetical protein, partial [Vibrio vulnificus]|uniref:hypothetical protein n=1 Tax=Vibrio vulnificus TaxID=672 RepID=UPI00405911FD
NKEAVASSIWLLFFLLECDSKLTHYHPNWLNFNSDNYPARGGFFGCLNCVLELVCVEFRWF